MVESPDSLHGNPAASRRLAEFIRERRDEILVEWERAVRRARIAADLDRPSLFDHVPELLDRLATCADTIATGGVPRLPIDLAEIHALARLDEGLDLAQVVTELALLRDCIVGLWAGEAGMSREDSIEIRALNHAIDRAVTASVQRYTTARDRTLQALDRIAAAALETRELDDLLDRLLRVFIETTAAVDTATILLRDGDFLRVRASVGLEGDVTARFALRIGEGFAGVIAQTQQPLHLPAADSDPLVLSPAIRARGVKGLFGAPLVQDGQVIGVAHMGSFTANEFSQQDRRVFIAMVHRATAAIFQHMLRDAAERRARQQQAVAALGKRVLAQREVAALLRDTTQTVSETLGLAVAVAFECAGEELAACAAHGWTGDPSALRIPFDDRWLAARVVRARTPEIVDDVAEGQHDIVPEIRERGFRSAIGVPIPLAGGRVYGALVAYAQQRRAFVEEHVAFLTSCAQLVGTVIELRDAEEVRARAHADTERALATLDTVLAASSVGMGFIDTDLRYVRINEALAAMNGRSVAEHVGHSIREVLGDGAADAIEPIMRRIITTGESVTNIEVAWGPRSFMASYVPVHSGGVTHGVGCVVVEITERKRMELDLRERELQLRTLADNIPQLAWMADTDGKVFWLNARWRAYTGMDVDDLAREQTQTVHPDHVERVVTRWRASIAAGVPWEDTFPMRGRDGRYRWFLSRAQPIYDEHGNVVRWFGTNTDISEQRFLSEATAILATTLDYRETLEHVARLAVPSIADWCAIDLVEADGGLERVEVAHTDPAKVELAHELARKYPTPPDAPRGIPAVIRTGRSELVAEIADDMIHARSRDPEFMRIIRSLGLTSLMIVPLVARQRILGAITFVSAESGRRFTPHDLELAEELAQRAGLAIDHARLYEDAQRETRIREDVLAIVSHDLKNPLNAIRLASSMLLEMGEPRGRKLADTIHRATSRMDTLITDLLDMASIQAGRLSLERKPEDADPLIREALDLHEPMCAEKGIALVRTCELPGHQLLCDRHRLLQVLGNLLGNAIKFCSSGDRVTMCGEIVGPCAKFAIIDTGPGIPPEELPYIFEPYWSARRHAKKGTGLGLYISKGIVEAHEGRIWADSTVGEGTTFHFTIPLAQR